MFDPHLLTRWLGAQPQAWLASCGAFAVAMSATPGPNNMMVAASGALFGFARTLPHILGVTIGFAVMVALIGVGGGGLLQHFPIIQSWLKWVAAAYLLWLAWRIATATPKLPAQAEAPATSGPDDSPHKRPKPISFLQAALFQWVNPKAWVAAVSAVSIYASPLRPALPQALILGGVFAGMGLVSVAMWTSIGAGAARFLRTPTGLRRFNLAMALLLAASVLSLFFER